MAKPSRTTPTFASRLVTWHAASGRHDLPWQNTRDPYRIWVSEIMLQQTQVATVIPYYERFMAEFPDVAALAAASEDKVLAHWAGLGYYARARNLHLAAQRIAYFHGGVFPVDRTAIESLPGIGRSTAAAIAAFAFGQRHAILDGNVKRVLARCFGIDGFPGERVTEARLWDLAETLLPPAADVPVYTQAQMDLGATTCTRSRPRCDECPLVDRCVAHRDNRVAELPTKRPAKVLPRRETGFLILRSGREVLMERRPPSGIWGGLWCFPECAVGDDILAVAALRAQVEGSTGPTLPPLEHAFTHFHLTIHPQIVDITRRTQCVSAPGRLWITSDDALGAAIPKPVRTLLLQLQALVP